jgi:hypothetical protein
MKNLTFLICIFFSITVKAQDISGYGDVGYSEVKLFHTLTDTQTDLDKVVAVRKQKQKYIGVGGSVSVTYEIEGEKSSLRLNADSAIFVISKGTGMFEIDISQMIQLFKLDLREGKRVAVEMDSKSYVNPLSMVSNKAKNFGKEYNNKIVISSKQLNERLTQIVPKNKLEKGEYAFLGGGIAEEGDVKSTKNYKVFVLTFGID